MSLPLTINQQNLLAIAACVGQPGTPTQAGQIRQACAYIQSLFAQTNSLNNECAQLMAAYSLIAGEPYLFEQPLPTAPVTLVTGWLADVEEACTNEVVITQEQAANLIQASTFIDNLRVTIDRWTNDAIGIRQQIAEAQR
jgi:hypothetical protein